VREHLRNDRRTGLARRTDVIPPESTEVLLALLAVWRRDGRATVRAVAHEAGRGVMATHTQLRCLDEAGLVAMGEAGALRPLVGAVKFGRRRRARRALTR
jgi:predicted transcriptional regulator